jgi:hypothetical protein
MGEKSLPLLVKVQAFSTGEIIYPPQITGGRLSILLINYLRKRDREVPGFLSTT